MTDLQVKYQVLRETQRANLVNEGLKAQDVASQVRLRESDIQLNDAQIGKVQQETENLRHEVALIDARTDLTKQQKATEKANTLKKWTEAIVGIIDPFGGLQEAAKSIGKGIGSSIGSIGGSVLGNELGGLISL